MTNRTVLVRLRADVSDFVAKSQLAKAAVRDFNRELDTSNDRTAWLAQGILALTPAVATLGAGAVPVLSGMATQMMLTVAAAGTMAIAFNGVGDALTALNDYQLDPTAENLDQLNVAMEKIGPSGQALVEYLDSLGPALAQLSNSARSGLFPGLMDGIDALMTRAPELNEILAEIGEAIGDLAAEGGEGLASERFSDFFDYLETRAKPILMDMGRTLGNFIDGLLNMLVAFDPLTQDFSSGLLDMSRSFVAWSDSLASSDGFQEFVEYVRKAGPLALDFLGSLIGFFVELAEAAAPVGAVMLPLLTGLLDVLSAIASTPAGPVLLGAAAGISAISRGIALYNIANGSAVLGLLRGAKVDGDAGARGLSNFGKAAAGLVAVTVAFTVLDELNKRLDETLPGLETLQSRLIDIANTPTGFSISLGAEFDSLAGSIERVTNPELTDGVQNVFDAIMVGDNRAKGLREASNEIAALDAALTDMVTSGNADMAERALSRLAEGYDLSASQIDTLMTLMPGYTGALQGVANDTALTADETDALGGAMDDAAYKTQSFTDSLNRLNNMLDGRADMRDYEAAIDDFTKSMKENGRTFDINTEKGRANQAALDGIVSSTLAVAEGMKGANRQRFLTSAIADLREMGERFNIPRSQLRSLIEELKEANRTKVEPKINADTAVAQARIERVRAQLAALDGDSATVTTIIRTVRVGGDTAGGPPELRVGADGTTVPKTGLPYADRHLYMLADGEEVISNRYGQADRFRADRAAGRIPGYAEGGTTGQEPRRRSVSGGVVITDRTEELEQAIRRLTEVQESQTEAVERDIATRDEWASKMASLATATTAGFQTGLFDRGSSNLWAAGAGGGWFNNLSTDISGLQRRGELQAQLGLAGLDGEALVQALTQGSNEDLASLLSSGRVQQFEDMVNQRALLTAQVGGAAGQQAFGPQWAAANEAAQITAAAAQQTNVLLAGIQGQLAQHQEALANIPERVTTGVVTGGNRAARRRRRDG